MRARLMLTLSIGLNLVMAAWVLYTLPPSSPGSLRTATVEGALGDTHPAARTRVVVRKQMLAWNDIESSDYPSYIANLRGIGCPESTIRDIIIAEVNQLYSQKRAASLASLDKPWWRTDADVAMAEAEHNLRQNLETERRQLLTRLLGPRWELAAQAMSASTSSVILSGPVLGQLSPEVRQTVQDIVARAEQRQKAYLAAQGQTGQDPDPADLARLRQQTRTELAQVLSPAQLEEYLLRYAPTASQMRQELAEIGFEFSPDEFRNLFRARDTLEQQSEAQSQAGESSGGAREKQLAQQWDLALKQSLSQERYRQFQLQRDPLFQQTRASLAQLGAPPEALLPVYEVNQLTLAEQQRIKNDPRLTPEEREKAILQIQEENEKSVKKILATRTRSAPANSPPQLP